MKRNFLHRNITVYNFLKEKLPDLIAIFAEFISKIIRLHDTIYILLLEFAF